MKICTKCLNSKPYSEFYRCKTNRDGCQGSCKSCWKLRLSEYYQENKETLDLENKRWAKENPTGRKAIIKRYYQSHKAEAAATCAKRNASKKNRTPKWLTKAQLKEITAWYALAKDLQWLSNETLEVDHIVPLQGKNVSGLHVPWNLQILPESQNRRKLNKF